MKLSVIIPCYNAAKTIAVQLEALANQQWSQPWEVIVADNASTDNSMEIVRSYGQRLPNLRIVDASDRKGGAHARNVGARAAPGESLAFCDADDEVGPGWVAAIGDALARYEFVASRFDTEKLNPLWVQRSLQHPQSKGLNPYRYPPYLSHAGGCGLGVRRALHNAVGGFDEQMTLLEDTDYCWRIQLAGKELHFVPDAVVHVRYRHTLAGIYRQARSYAEYNVVIYKKYRRLGMPPLSWKSGARAWLGLLQRLPSIRDRVSLSSWVWQFAWRVGRLQGSIKHRVVAW